MEAHRCKFIDWKGASISALAFRDSSVKTKHLLTECDQILAVGQSNGDIQLQARLTNPPRWTLYNTIHGNDPGLTSVVWVGERLFSSGFSGTITEWDLKTMLPRVFPYDEMRDNTGLPPVWCMSVFQKTKVEKGEEMEDDQVSHDFSQHQI